MGILGKYCTAVPRRSLYDFATNLIFNSVAERKNNTNRNRIRSGSGWILSGKRIRSATIFAIYFNETAFTLYEIIKNYAQTRYDFCCPGEEGVVFEIRQKRFYSIDFRGHYKTCFEKLSANEMSLYPENQFDLKGFFSFICPQWRHYFYEFPTVEKKCHLTPSFSVACNSVFCFKVFLNFDKNTWWRCTCNIN
jgi:hypothetical protein